MVQPRQAPLEAQNGLVKLPRRADGAEQAQEVRL